MRNIQKPVRCAALRAMVSIAMALLFIPLLSSCAREQAGPAAGTDIVAVESSADGGFISLAPSDMSGYAAFENYDGELCFVDMTVEDILSLKEAGESFAFVATFSTCPWCNMILPALNETALQEDMQVGCLDTRKDPAWTSNLDITGYDRFAETFADYLTYDSNDRLHLYTPHVFFIREGEVADEHQGALPEIEDPNAVLSDRQEASLEEIFREGFRSMK